MFLDNPVKLYKTDTITQSAWKAIGAFLYAMKNWTLMKLIEAGVEISDLEQFQQEAQYIKFASSDKFKGSNPVRGSNYYTKMVKITAVVSNEFGTPVAHNCFGSFIHATGWITLSCTDSGSWKVTDNENTFEIEQERMVIDFRWNKRDPNAKNIQSQIECNFEQSWKLDQVDFSPLH